MRKFFYLVIILFLIFMAYVIGVGMGASSGGFDLDTRDKVAVLNIEDIILDSTVYLESLNKIRKNDDVKALVVRINSPGGAVGPSQEIYQELESIKKEKPVVASMGTVAASGGYYIACAAERIYANPGTITGSIGVIAQFVNYRELMNWAKLEVEVIKSGKFKDLGSPVREMSDREKEYLQQMIDNVHSQFKDTVQTTRGLSSEDLNRIADGRIFTGEQAKGLKLVDEIGSLSDAIHTASEMGGIEGEPGIIKYPEEKSVLQQVLGSNLDIAKKIRGFPPNKSFGLFYIVDIIH